MPGQSNNTRRPIKVFIASSEYLEEERRCFRDIIDEVNRSKAHGSGIQLEPLGWEDTLPGVGRPQELVNEVIEECDLTIMILWKWWGTPTGEYSSEFEEEYELAKRLHEERGKPDEIMFYFREIPKDMRADPGEQLERVLKFREKIESERKFYPYSYKDENEWKILFRKHLSQWIDKLNDYEPEKKSPPPKPTPYDDSLFEVSTLDAFYELTKNVNFLEKPLQDGEWKSKRKVVNFDKRWIETARSGLNTHQILLITGPPNVGKSTFLLFFLNECLESGINDWDSIIFLNPFIGEEMLDSVLKDVDISIQSNYGRNNTLLVIDGLRREEDDKNYLKKSIRLFEKTCKHNYRLIVTLRDSEKEFLKSELKNLGKWGWHIRHWRKFEPNIEELLLTYNRGELEKILVNYLNYHDDKIGLQGISFDEINRFYSWEETPLEKKKQYQAFRGCMETVVNKSEGLAGYIAFLVEDMAKHKSVFSDETVKKYPRGMTNLILDTISKDFYVEGNYIQNDDVIPLLVMLLTKLKYPMTEQFFDSIMAWGFGTLDTTLKTEDKGEITDKINNFIRSYTFHTTFIGADEYSLLNLWKDAIGEAIYKGKYDKNYNDIVNKFKKMEGDLRYWIEQYISDKGNELKNRNGEFFSGGHLVPDAVYLVGDIAKLVNMTEINTINTLDPSTEFFKEHLQKHGTSLHHQFDFLKQTLFILWSWKAKGLVEKLSYECAIEAYKEAIDIDSEDSRAYWWIGTCYEKIGKNEQAIGWYIKSADKWDTPKGYTSLIKKVVEYIKKHTLQDDDKLKYLEVEENAALSAIRLDHGDYISWSMYAQVLKVHGIILKKRREKHPEAILKLEKAIKAYQNAMGMSQQFRKPKNGFYYHNIGYCYKNLADIQKQLRNYGETKKCLENAIDKFKSSAEIENNKRGYLQLAKIMSQKSFYSEDNYACEEALEKIDRNTLDGDELVDYCFTCGIDYINKKKFESALENFAETKKLIFSEYLDAVNISVLDDDWRIYKLIVSIHKYMGICHEERGDYKKAIENYIAYIYLKEYTSEKEHKEYAKKILEWNLNKEAQRYFWNASKIDTRNAENLILIAIANAWFGYSEEVMSNLVKPLDGRISSYTEKKLRGYINELDNTKEISRILERICDIAYLAISGMKKEELSDEWHQLAILTDSMKIGDPILDILYDNIRAAAVDATELDSTIEQDEIDRCEYELSNEWNRIGKRIQEINEETTFKIPYSVVKKCFELSLELNPNNPTSWYGMGWLYYYIGICTGNNSCYNKARAAFRNSIRIEEECERENNHISFSKIGIGRTYEREGDATSAATCFNASFKTLTESQCKSKKTVDLLLKTAESLEDLKFLDVSNDEKIKFMKYALGVYKKALDVTLSICPTDIQTFLLRLKIRSLEKQEQYIEAEKNHEVAAATIPHAELLMSKKYSDKVFENRIRNILSQVSKNPDDYNLFKQVIESEFEYIIRSKRNKKVRYKLVKLVSLSLKQASKEFPFETPSKILQSCQKLCEELYDEYEKDRFSNLFDTTVIHRFRKIVFGDEYYLGPIESEEELITILNKYEKAFGKLGVKIPKPDEIEKECKRNEDYENHRERVERIFG